MAKIFLTGITGFLGSNVARYLISRGHHVIAITRLSANRHLCDDFADEINWIEQDIDNRWVQRVVEHRPEVIIHSAWIGVGHNERNDWDCQYQNIKLLQSLLHIAKQSGTSKFIGFGSQSEYGTYSGCVTEDEPLNAVEAYGCVKIICSEIVRQFCKYHKINWYWLRLFSFFGKGESENWLIASLIRKMATDNHMDLTAGEQKYSYLFADDLGVAVNSIVNNDGRSGIYNISAKTAITIKQLIETVRDMVKPSFNLNFGLIPYRANQVMHMQGNSSKFVEEFGEFDVSNFNDSLSKTVGYLREKFNFRDDESI